jgi:VWFA-related protein
MIKAIFFLLAVAVGAAFVCPHFVVAQPPGERDRARVRTMSIPISIFTKQELENKQAEELIMADRLTVRENGDEQTILSIRSVWDAPLSLAIVVQEDLDSGFNLHLKDLRAFIRRLPKGSRVMVAYTRGGSLQVRQKFTEDLERAANSLRVVASNTTLSGLNPYESVVDVLNRFDALPAGRRAILLFSDGLDASRGLDSTEASQSIDLDRAILRAQRRGVAVFSIWNPTELTSGRNSRLVLNAQGALEKLSDQTGGRAFFQGSGAPVSMLPFFRDLGLLLNRQFLLSYLSTHMKKGYYKIQVTSSNPSVMIEHPKGYYYR